MQGVMLRIQKQLLLMSASEVTPLVFWSNTHLTPETQAEALTLTTSLMQEP